MRVKLLMLLISLMAANPAKSSLAFGDIALDYPTGFYSGPTIMYVIVRW